MKAPDIFERVLSIGELTEVVKESIELTFKKVSVVGEISDLARPRSGHIYFTLKDDRARLKCVIWRGVAARLNVDLEDGIEVVASGGLTVYEPRGEYQLIVKRLELRGLGALQLKFLKLKEKLEKEGLFNPEHRLELPEMAFRIAVVTSATGAAFRDILNVAERRFGGVEIYLYPVLVQGKGAAEEIAGAITDLNKFFAGRVDAIIVGRGGGSLEDLWAFNEEAVARAIYESKIPTVSAVGHEIDVSIADLVADRRAATPTEAAEILIPRRDALLDRLSAASRHLRSSLAGSIDIARANLDAIRDSAAFDRPRQLIEKNSQLLDDTAVKINRETVRLVRAARDRLENCEKVLVSVSPYGILERGYAIVCGGDKKSIVTSVEQLAEGRPVSVEISDGRFDAAVEKIERKRPPVAGRKPANGNGATGG